MRTYLLEKRIIQLALLITCVVLFVGMMDVWKGADNKAGVNNRSDAAGNQGAVLKNTKIVCIGDSYTSGYPGTAENAWPSKLAGQLGVEVMNAGESGLTSTDLLGQFEQKVVTQEPGRVILFAGNADAVKGVGIQTFQDNIKEMVSKAKEKGITPILVLPLPISGTEESIASFRAWEGSYAKDNNLTVLDFQQVLADQDGKLKAEYTDTGDNRYPNAAGHQVMGDYMAKMLK
ncbi:lipolytic protein G-D-S-L family [Syntrophobotulus glycolicus DSM 8271]|uniref:Lipolytic protein G-D-S-L family n=1 Tax=Syntrophobotulus glycolicus (strain DSM 8271 / FlGlyR) TaxID=645991 RepID=F0SWM2_SYNGF|nr:GDSL-type esterase/lipase family protein [Syntrophobotulus glycolicus]ADY56862.1 lipolytic protein G-D-S-L family [Syntrophobotulus glycolicus DSM 8271]